MVAKYIKLLSSFKERQVSTNIIDKVNAYVSTALADPRLHEKIEPYFRTRNAEGVPFTNYEEDPDNVSQIKKLVNALYYARLAFVGLENLDLSSWSGTFEASKHLLGDIIENGYEAAFLATHLDVNLQEMFQEEIQLLFSVLSTYRKMAKKHSEETQRLTATLKTYPIANKVGAIAGMAVGQMQANGGSYDYEFLTQFSTVLPSYIDQLTQYINKYSSKLVEKEPSLSNEKTAELHQAGLALLNDLEHLKGNSVFISFKFLKYIHIINNIITLTMSSLEQVGNFSESSQDVIRDNLARLKYEVLPTLFGLVDKIEVNFMLKPGTLSIPLMEKIKPFYESLIYYVGKPVNFAVKGEELLSIEDSRFLTLRLERTYARINDAHKALFKIDKAEEALNQFYQVLEQPEYANLTIHQLPIEIRQELITSYKILTPYVNGMDVDFNNLMIASLHGNESWGSYLSLHHWLPDAAAEANPSSSWFSFTGVVKGSLQWMNRLPADHLSLVLEKKDLLTKLVAKDRNTQQFHIDLNNDVISSVQKETDLNLFPYCASNNIFILDEETALHGDGRVLTFTKRGQHNYVTDREQLSCEQALTLHHWYNNKHAKFMSARDAYNAFMDSLTEQSADGILDVTQLSAEDKAEYRKLYNLFQPYFINGVPTALREQALDYDKYLVHALGGKPPLFHNPAIDIFAKLNVHFQDYFTKIDLNWRKKSKVYEQLAEKLFQSENKKSALAADVDTKKRAHHLISHTHYSKLVREIKIALFATVELLNQPMQAALKCNNGLPFPELEEDGLIAAQLPQVVPIKKLFNSVYHLEAIVLEMEALNNKSAKITYVYHLISAYGHINTIIPTLQELAHDPHFNIIGRELLGKAQALLATIQEQSDAYQQAPQQITAVEGNVQYNGLWYSLNAFFISPKHIRSLRNNNYLTTEELNELHARAKQAALIIENLIRNSSSVVQLFLQAPKMLHLYGELTNKLNEFLSTAHDSVMNNLDQLTPKLFTPLLLEADRWEDQVGLKPGTISGLLKQIMDEFHKGLLHPLQLQSQTHITLICDKTTLIKRQEQVTANIERAEANLSKLEERYAAIKTLAKCLEVYQNFEGGIGPPPSMMLRNDTKKELIIAYQAALSKLNSLKLKNHIRFEPSSEPADFALDAMLNAPLKRYDPKLVEIKTIIKASYIYYQSRKATYEMQRDTALEKQEYLQELNVAQDNDRILFIANYTKASFDRQLTTFYERHTGFKHLDEEYRNKLNAYLLTFEEQIIEQAKTSDDINLTIKNLLQEHTQTFAQQHFAAFYHLDNIRKALSLFSDYLFEYRNSSFEDDVTMDKKARRINRLIRISADQDKTLDQRFEEINKEVNFNPNFGRELLAHKHVDPLSFTYLLLCIASLLEALHLYTPTKKRLHNNITSATSNMPTSGEILKRFGLFVEIPPKAEEPEPNAEENVESESIPQPG